MKPPRILIVDDETSVRFVLKNTLKNEGYAVNTAVHGGEALEKLSENSYDLLLLDLQMEPVDGLQVLTEIKELDPDLTVIILTAYGSVESAVEALRYGAFDYLFKPATPDTIRQRVQDGLQYRQQNLRQRHLMSQVEALRQILNKFDEEPDCTDIPTSEQRLIQSDNLMIDEHNRLVTLKGELLELTTAEFDVLLCLVKAAPNPLTPTQLVKCALGYDTDEIAARDIVKWHIHQLRRKIDPHRSQYYIKTVRYKGYLWCSK